MPISPDGSAFCSSSHVDHLTTSVAVVPGWLTPHNACERGRRRAPRGECHQYLRKVRQRGEACCHHTCYSLLWCRTVTKGFGGCVWLCAVIHCVCRYKWRAACCLSGVVWLAKVCASVHEECPLQETPHTVRAWDFAKQRDAQPWPIFSGWYVWFLRLLKQESVDAAGCLMTMSHFFVCVPHSSCPVNISIWWVLEFRFSSKKCLIIVSGLLAASCIIWV